MKHPRLFWLLLAIHHASALACELRNLCRCLLNAAHLPEAFKCMRGRGVSCRSPRRHPLLPRVVSLNSRTCIQWHYLKGFLWLAPNATRETRDARRWTVVIWRRGSRRQDLLCFLLLYHHARHPIIVCRRRRCVAEKPSCNTPQHIACQPCPCRIQGVDFHVRVSGLRMDIRHSRARQHASCGLTYLICAFVTHAHAHIN